MNSFERSLIGDRFNLPSEEASAFFISMKRPLVKSAMHKTAGWEDPPDELGVLEGQFEVPLEFAVNLMGKCVMNLMRMLSAGIIYSKSLRGEGSEGVRRLLEGSTWEYESAVKYLVERMTVLAGAPHIPEFDMPPPSTEPFEVAKKMIRAEQEAILSYHELIAVLGSNPMKEKIKCFMGQCQSHLDQYWMAVPPEFGTKPMGVHPPQHLLQHEENETPQQEEVESPEFEQAEEAAGVEGEEGPEEEGQKTSSLRKVATALTKTAKEGQTDAELREVGRQRAVTNIAAEHHREAARRAERVGRVAGLLGGAATGAALGRAIGKGSATHTLAGAALGGLGGRHLGGELGTEIDIARHKTANVKALAAKLAGWVKRADDMSTGMPEQEAPMASPTDNQELEPVNYLQAELMGQQYQDRNEANFYRQRAVQAQQMLQQAQQGSQMQMQQMQQQLVQNEALVNSAAQRIKAALDSATRASDDALKQTETAARMRIGQQNLRMQLMELASQDPDQQAASLNKLSGF